MQIENYIGSKKIMTKEINQQLSNSTIFVVTVANHKEERENSNQQLR